MPLRMNAMHVRFSSIRRQTRDKFNVGQFSMCLFTPSCGVFTELDDKMRTLTANLIKSRDHLVEISESNWTRTKHSVGIIAFSKKEHMIFENFSEYSFPLLLDTYYSAI
ncbi:hypothetical protein AVEN_98505-1 [Araneus ventricosus]|uniref:Uncharacterized protein n=1 Tax=Araneus ventricosus TaxID=182803 RepID=A0A4Y2ETQ5_ARAVE|nr:hypothetical protein AVEN_98505-1 [Araneus ventricosus]